MHLLSAFRELPLSLLLVSFALLSAAVPINPNTELTPDNFGQLTATGLWFVEFFSPYCGHCTKFAPTWQLLVDASKNDILNLAQVDCSVHGDLCHEQSVRGYPTMRMYYNAESRGEYDGPRNLPDLQKFVREHIDAVNPPQKEEPIPIPNPDGEVLKLTEATFAANIAKGPLFVKFFAPWCGHCKKLAPVWKQLAKHLKGKLAIAEVNCDENQKLCKLHDVTGYPTLLYLSGGGLQSVYNGGRKLDQLKTFAEKASSAGVHTVKTEDLDGVIDDNEVMYLLIHSAAETAIVDTVRRASAVLLGSPSIYTSDDPTLFTRFSIPQTNPWALIAIKDHDPLLPSSVLSDDSASIDTIRKWLLSQRLPTTIELTQDSFQAVMSAPQAPLVVIAAVTPAMKDEVKARFADVGKKWRIRTKGSGIARGTQREVVWAWMDRERWGDWMKSMYGIVPNTEEKELDDVKVVITDHKRLVYYDMDPMDGRLRITNTMSLFATAEAAAAGDLLYKHSENKVERLARYLNNKMILLESFVFEHPWRSAFFLFGIFAAVFIGLRRLFADDVPSEYRKVDRLD